MDVSTNVVRGVVGRTVVVSATVVVSSVVGEIVVVSTTVVSCVVGPSVVVCTTVVVGSAVVARINTQSAFMKRIEYSQSNLATHSLDGDQYSQ